MMADVNYDGARAVEVAEIMVKLCNDRLGNDLRNLASAISEEAGENAVATKINEIAADYNKSFNLYTGSVNDMKAALMTIEGMEEYFKAAEKKLLGNVKADTTAGGKNIKGFALGHRA